MKSHNRCIITLSQPLSRQKIRNHRRLNRRHNHIINVSFNEKYELPPLLWITYYLGLESGCFEFFLTNTLLTASRKKTKFSKSTSPEVEDPLEQSSDTSSTSVKQSRDRTSSSDIVYGVVKTHTSPQQEALPQVRDPTKEILRGLWGSSDYSSSRRGGGGGRRPPYHQYGRIQTHERPDSVVTPASPFQKLQTELYGPRRTGSTKDASENTSTYGTVHRFSPKTASSRVSTSSKLDQIRSMLNQESPISDNDNEISGSSSSPSKNAFDRIREKLMNTRVRERFRTARERNLRKKGSKKRRRNVSYTLHYYHLYLWMNILNPHTAGLNTFQDPIIFYIIFHSLIWDTGLLFSISTQRFLNYSAFPSLFFFLLHNFVQD